MIIFIFIFHHCTKQPNIKPLKWNGGGIAGSRNGCLMLLA